MIVSSKVGSGLMDLSTAPPSIAQGNAGSWDRTVEYASLMLLSMIVAAAV